MQPINIIEYFEETARNQPNRIAVWDEGSSLTFADLRERALAAALRLTDLLDGRRREIIAVLMPKSLEMIIVQLGIIYSGNVCMNIDINNPPQRTLAILRQTKAALAVVSGAKADWPSWEYDNAAPKLDEAGKKHALGLREGLIDRDALFVINTSGSTGAPKSVALSHRSFIDFIQAVDCAGIIGKNEIAGSLAPPVFDHYCFELCLMMSRACTLALLPHSLAAFPVRLLELMQTRRVSFIFWVPSIMVNIANMDLLSHVSLKGLKTVWFAGEVFPTAKFNYWRRLLPQASFVNLYGPTEATVDCLYYKITGEMDEDKPIPIGKPFRNTEILILNENGKQAAKGEEGEICVRGASIALGYCGDSEKTAQAFRQNPQNDLWPDRIYHTGDIGCLNDDGNIIFKGRKDSMIKLHGYRIELGEIEHVAINAALGITNCCALCNSFGDQIFLVYEAPEKLPVKHIQAGLREKLPRYMMPARYIHLEKMPLNVNGKLDRRLLKKQFIEEKA